MTVRPSISSASRHAWIRPGAFDAHLGHRPEGAHPLEHRLVALGGGVEGLHTEHAADRVQGGGHVDVQVGVDSTDDSAASFYNGHGHPFSLIGSRGGAAVP